MRKYLRLINPKRAVDDFAEQWQQPTPHRWQILGVACAATFALIMLFLPESQRKEPARPEITYITTWDESRSREEIIASNIANQERKERIAALLEERAELRKELYRELGRATGLDVDQMEAEIRAEEEADRAAAEAAQAAMLRQSEDTAAEQGGE